MSGMLGAGSCPQGRCDERPGVRWSSRSRRRSTPSTPASSVSRRPDLRAVGKSSGGGPGPGGDGDRVPPVAAGFRDGNPTGFVQRTASHLAASAVRRRVAEAKAMLRLTSQRTVVRPLDEPDEQFWAAVQRLPTRQAQAVALRYIYDCPVSEVAEVMSISEGAAKAHLFRGRQALIRALGLPTDRAGDGGVSSWLPGLGPVRDPRPLRGAGCPPRHGRDHHDRDRRAATRRSPVRGAPSSRPLPPS